MYWLLKFKFCVALDCKIDGVVVILWVNHVVGIGFLFNLGFVVLNFHHFLSWMNIKIGT